MKTCRKRRLQANVNDKNEVFVFLFLKTEPNKVNDGAQRGADPPRVGKDQISDDGVSEANPSPTSYSSYTQLYKKFVRPAAKEVLKLNLISYGSFRSVREDGKQIIRDVIASNAKGDDGLLTDRPLLVVQRKPDNYVCINGNHRLSVFIDMGISEWPCEVIKDDNITPEEEDILAAGLNEEHDGSAVHITPFERFEFIVRKLESGRFPKKSIKNSDLPFDIDAILKTCTFNINRKYTSENVRKMARIYHHLKQKQDFNILLWMKGMNSKHGGKWKWSYNHMLKNSVLNLTGFELVVFMLAKQYKDSCSTDLLDFEDKLKSHKGSATLGKILNSLASETIVKKGIQLLLSGHLEDSQILDPLAKDLIDRKIEWDAFVIQLEDQVKAKQTTAPSVVESAEQQIPTKPTSYSVATLAQKKPPPAEGREPEEEEEGGDIVSEVPRKRVLSQRKNPTREQQLTTRHQKSSKSKSERKSTPKKKHKTNQDSEGSTEKEIEFSMESMIQSEIPKEQPRMVVASGEELSFWKEHENLLTKSNILLVVVCTSHIQLHDCFAKITLPLIAVMPIVYDQVLIEREDALLGQNVHYVILYRSIAPNVFKDPVLNDKAPPSFHIGTSFKLGPIYSPSTPPAQFWDRFLRSFNESVLPKEGLIVDLAESFGLLFYCLKLHLPYCIVNPSKEFVKMVEETIKDRM